MDRIRRAKLSSRRKAATLAVATADDEVQQRAAKILDELIRRTGEIFKSEVKLVSTCDPEFAADRYTVLIVETVLNSEQRHAAELEWIDSVGRNWPSLRLSIRRRK